MAIPAELENAQIGGRDREPRRKLHLRAVGTTASGNTTAVLVQNISTTGLLLQGELALSIGETIEIELPHAGMIRATTIWKSENLFGCQFVAPVSQAALSAAQLRSDGKAEIDIGGLGPSDGESFGVRLQRLRKTRGLTLAQVAEELGVSKPTVWAWENGKARPIENRMEALAGLMGVAASELQAGRDTANLRELLARSREQIATAVGTSSDKIKIVIEL